MAASSVDTIVAHVQALIERGRTTQARDQLKTALASYPSDHRLQLLDAQADYLDDNNDAALITVQRILASNPDYAAARELLFNVQLDAKQYGAAEESILGLLKDYPEEPNYFGRYGLLMLRAMQHEKAAQLAEAGLRLDPQNVQCLIVRAMVELIEQPSGHASAGLQQLLVGHPDSLRTLLLVVIALQDRGDYRDAHRLAQELVRVRPDNEHLVNLVKELSVATHWSMMPLWPMQKFGWRAVIGFWVASVVAINVTKNSAPQFVGPLTIIILVYVAYSWIWPRVIRYYLMRRS